MEQSQANLEEIRLIGLTTRTRNQDEIDPMKGKIFPVVQRYFSEALAQKIPSRKKPDTTYCVYTQYETDHTGEYTYFIGEAVDSLADVPEGFETLTIPTQKYAKFTTGPDSMPSVLHKAWQKIWSMSDIEFGGKRKYIADFEVYDERAQDHENIVLDIYIGID